MSQSTFSPNLPAIRQGDCIEQMRAMNADSVDLAFADPPFNIGYEYDQYHDKQTDQNYLGWSRDWMQQVHRLLKPTGTFWLAIGDEYAADLKVIAERELGFVSRSWVIWYYTFGVNCKRKFSRSHVHLFHFVKQVDQFTFNADDPDIRIPSARALVYGDKRANPKGRLPDDTWILRPQDFQSDCYGFDSMDDTWYFSRVAGTFKERQGFHGCQMPEQLLGRVIRSCSNQGDMVFDPFSGSGTTLAVAKKLGRQWLGCELSKEYVRYASERIDAIAEGDKLNGPADSIGSAPTTAKGRRLKGQSLLPTFEPEDLISVESAPSEEAEKSRSGACDPPAKVASVDFREMQHQVLSEAYLQSAESQSVDRLLADPLRQTAFHATCRKAGLLGSPGDWNHKLLQLRKAGKLPKQPHTKVDPVTAVVLDQYQFAAEIAWHLTSLKFGGQKSGAGEGHEITIDEILTHPDYASFFDRTAACYAPGFETRDYRWAAIDFRKSRHALVAEAKKYDYVFATRDFESHRKLTRRAAESLAGQAGVYLLTGLRQQPLFVGETLDLGARLALHATAPATNPSATKTPATKTAVAKFSVILQDDLPSGEYRSPLKVDLVRRCSPEWNLR